MSQKTHELKIAPNFFGDIALGDKNFEIRFNDRKFNVGDILFLKEFFDGEYKDGRIVCEIGYILEDYTGLENGYVILGLKHVAVVRP